jgi:hypothetical protein
MSPRSLETSPQAAARIGGALYLIIIALGLFDESGARDALVVSGDAAATAANIRAHELLWRLGVATHLFYLGCAVALALIFYVLLRRVNRDLALMAASFSLVSIAVEAVGKLFLLLPLFLLGDAPYLKAFTPEQLQALAYVCIRADGYGFGLALIFFSGWCLLTGHLIRRSGFLPAALGYALPVAGLCYLANSFALLLSPALAGALFPAILVPAFFAELSLGLWLLLKGVDAAGWKRYEAAS